ncbi:PIGA protein, partial [Opisthorchis viverrini]
MACDFFFPNVGGVETHIYSLAQCLIRRGHRVIVITHSYGPVGKQRQSVRYMGRGLKVYYLPLVPFYRQTIFFTLFGTLPIIREILIREQVDLLHGHSSFSDLGHEAILHAQSLGIRTVFTDHSLFGFADLSSVTMNKVVESVLSAVDHVICVSHTCKENTVLRSKLDPNRVFVIPNAIESSQFTPDPTAKDPNFVLRMLVKIATPIFSETSFSPTFVFTLPPPHPFRLAVTVVIVSRLVYRKGIDLLVAIIPPLCTLFPEVRFLIVHASPDSSPNTPLCETPTERAWRMHNWVKNAYSWPQVARRTEKVYYSAVAREKLTFEQLIERSEAYSIRLSFIVISSRLSQRGGLTGPTLVVLAWIHWLFLQFLCWWRPEHTISKVPYLAYPVEDTTKKSSIRMRSPNSNDGEHGAKSGEVRHVKIDTQELEETNRPRAMSGNPEALKSILKMSLGLGPQVLAPESTAISTETQRRLSSVTLEMLMEREEIDIHPYGRGGIYEGILYTRKEEEPVDMLGLVVWFIFFGSLVMMAVSIIFVA